jgi:hypothetical protein
MSTKIGKHKKVCGTEIINVGKYNSSKIFKGKCNESARLLVY